MSKINRAIIEQIKDRIDIIQYIGRHVKLRQRGKDFKGLCPFHNEKTPSFSVVPEKGFYHCFGCERHGDIIDFVKEYDAVSFFEAIEILADYSGVDISQEEEEAVEYTALKLNHDAMQIYSNNGSGMEKFFKERHLSKDLIKIFHLGVAINNVVAKALKDNAKILLETGLIYKKEGGGYCDRFEKRLIFPIIHNKYPIGFGGRRIESWQRSKYINSKGSMIYDKSRALFGLGQAKQEMRKNGSTYLVEGYTDVLAMWTMGIKNAVASCGTAFHYKQSRILAGTCSSVRIVFDGDAAGRQASYKAVLTLLRNGIIPYITELPKFSDPNQLLKDMGKEKARKYIEDNSKVFFEHYGEMVSSHPIERKIRLVKDLRRAMGGIIDEVTRSILQKDVGEYFGEVETSKSYNRYKKSIAVSLDQQMLQCLLSPHIGPMVYSMVKPEDFLENTEIFKYILDGYEPNGFPDVEGLLEKYKDSGSYISRAVAPSKQFTLNKAFVLARKLRLRTINRLITELTNEIEKAGKKGGNLTVLGEEWEELRREQLILSKIINDPQW